MLCYQLKAVSVSSDNHTVPPGGLTLPGDGPDEVVGLVAGKFVAGDIHGIQHILQHGHLLSQFLRHPLALRLISLVLQMPESWLFPVEGHADGFRGLLVHQPLERCHKTINCVGIKSVLRCQGADAIK